jgi:hypothetical protein
MRVAIHQPQYLPWSGLFDKIDRADCFVILDVVQYEKNEWQNRNRIKTGQGWQWLTVPVHYHFPERIREVRIDEESGWRRKHWQTLAQSYRKAPCFDQVAPLLEPLYGASWEWLIDLNLASLDRLGRALGLRWAPRLASEMTLSEEPTQRLIDICRNVGADYYVAGSGSRDYLRPPLFEKAGITVEFQEFTPPAYPQLYGPFEPGLSVIDMLFNCGRDAMARLRRARSAPGESTSEPS